jgi:hypothetical protein
MVSVESFGASFLVPLDAVFGGVAVCPVNGSSKCFLGRLGVTFFLGSSNRVSYGPGDEGSRFEGSTGGRGRLGFGEKWCTWVASSAAISFAFEDLRLISRACGGLGVVSANELLVSLPGVELKTEYSSANVGVQPLRSSKLDLLFPGV